MYRPVKLCQLLSVPMSKLFYLFIYLFPLPNPFYLAA